MLTSIARLLAVGVAMAVALAPWAVSAAGPVCEVRDPSTGICQVYATDPGSGGGGGGTTPTGPAKCMYKGSEIPCTSDTGSWYAPNQCYIRLSPAQPLPTDPVWQGETTGAIYECYPPNSRNGVLIWIEQAPAQVDPEQLAQQAIAAMNLKAVPIGIAPKAETGKIGIVGMPVWMWSTSGDPTVTGPVTQTASAGAVTVTATATLVSTVWDMDDGQKVTCWGGKALGTAYTASYGLKDSPTCGYRYSSQGDFTVTATSNWEIQWAGLGQTGTIQISLSSTADIRIGEVQVLVQ